MPLSSFLKLTTKGNLCYSSSFVTSAEFAKIMCFVMFFSNIAVVPTLHREFSDIF